MEGERVPGLGAGRETAFFIWLGMEGEKLSVLRPGSRKSAFRPLGIFKGPIGFSIIRWGLAGFILWVRHLSRGCKLTLLPCLPNGRASLFSFEFLLLTVREGLFQFTDSEFLSLVSSTRLCGEGECTRPVSLPP